MSNTNASIYEALVRGTTTSELIRLLATSGYIEAFEDVAKWSASVVSNTDSEEVINFLVYMIFDDGNYSFFNSILVVSKVRDGIKRHGSSFSCIKSSFNTIIQQHPEFSYIREMLYLELQNQ